MKVVKKKMVIHRPTTDQLKLCRYNTTIAPANPLSEIIVWRAF